MSSRFARHGTTGYRWPKVCQTRPKQPPTSPAVMVAPTLYATIIINDPAFPANNTNVTDFPVPWAGSGATYQVFPGPGTATQITISLSTSAGVGFCNIIFGAQTYQTGTVFAPYTLGAPYSAGPYTIRNPMFAAVGTITVHT